MSDKTITAINRSLCMAIMSDGQQLPITNWINADGVCDPEDALAFVCGPDANGKWHMDDVQSFETARVQ